MQQLELQRQQLEEIRRLREPERQPEEIPVLDRIKVSKNGEEWGEFNIHVVRRMLENGDLTLEDYYYSPDHEDWITLNQLLD